LTLIPPKGERLLSFTGALLVAIAILGIAHFTVSSALARFPSVMLSSAHNWIFIGLHALIGYSGLIVFSLGRKRS